MSGGMLLALLLLGSGIGTIWRSQRLASPRVPSQNGDAFSKLGGWLLSPLLHLGLALVAGLLALGHLPQPLEPSPQAPSFSAGLMREEQPLLPFTRVPDLPRYGRVKSSEESPAVPALEPEPAAPPAPEGAALRESAASRPESAGSSLPTKLAREEVPPEELRPSADRHPSGGDLAGAAALPRPRTPAARPLARPSSRSTEAAQRGRALMAGRPPSILASKLQGSLSAALGRASVSPELVRRAALLRSSSWRGTTGAFPWGARSLYAAVPGASPRGVVHASAIGPLLRASVLARVALGGSGPAGRLQAANSEQRGPSSLSLNGTAMHPLQPLTNGGLSGSSIRTASGSINGTDFRTRH